MAQKMKIYDISRPISPEMAIWPGDTPFSVTSLLELRMGASVNLTTLTLSSHTGSHVDAFSHFIADGATMEAMPLAAYIGPATVVTVDRPHGPLTLNDFPQIDWEQTERLLVHSAASAHPLDQFPIEFVYPAPELADFLGSRDIVLFGSDAPSMDHVDSKTLIGHHALHRNNIAILEGLWLTGVPDGLYELIALPLKISGGDGSPVRAVLRTAV
jgi:arylformamidase